MYQASTVFTGSEMPALMSRTCGGAIFCCAAAGCAAAHAASANTMLKKRRPCFIVCPPPYSSFRSALKARARNDDSKLPEQPAETVDAVLDTAAAQRIPDDRLVCGHAIDAELTLQHVERAGRRPMRRREKYRVGIGMLAHQFAAHVDRGMARDAADLVEGRAPAGRAQHLAAEMLGVAGDAVGLGFLVGLADHDFFAAERFCSSRLGRSAGRDLDLQLGFEIADDL